MKIGCIFIDHWCAACFDSFIPAIIAAGQYGHLSTSNPAIHYGFSICDVGLHILSYSHVLSLRVVLVLPEGIKVNAGVCVGRGGGCGGVYVVLGQDSRTFNSESE
jgi:hypothetical protein